MTVQEHLIAIKAIQSKCKHKNLDQRYKYNSAPEEGWIERKCKTCLLNLPKVNVHPQEAFYGFWISEGRYTKKDCPHINFKIDVKQEKEYIELDYNPYI